MRRPHQLLPQHCKFLLPAVSLLLTVAIISPQLSALRYHEIARSWNAPRITSTRPLELLEEVRDLEIREVVQLPDDEFLLLATTSDLRATSSFTTSGSCSIAIGSEAVPARIVGAGSIGEGRRSIRCRIDSPFRQKVNDSSRVRAQLRSLDGSKVVESSSEIPLMHWNNRMVYEALITDRDVVLFTKGIFPSRKPEQERAIMNLTRCVYFNDDSSEVVAETQLLSLSQEIVRCRHPPSYIRPQLIGNKISIRTSIIEPSGVFYHSPRIMERLQTNNPAQNRHNAADAELRHSVCACTMIYNSAKFLKEWIRYHSHLGVSKFFLYDNNSEDSLEETVQHLNKESPNGVIATRAWPWIKTQESGFSHCALVARDECEWMAFVDVDEFIFPKAYLKKPGSDSGPTAGTREQGILQQMISDTVQGFVSSNSSNATGIGQISIRCRDFGPSGLTRHPTAGVTQGYTCRVVKDRREKSLVRLEALDRSLTNVIHHFNLSPRFATAKIPPWQGVVNHYKYQAWDEFKNKFKRRVSSYVSDWRENKNINSQDRTPGLGTEAVKPHDWENQFCEVEDTELRDYVQSRGLDLRH